MYYVSCSLIFVYEKTPPGIRRSETKFQFGTTAIRNKWQSTAPKTNCDHQLHLLCDINFWKMIASLICNIPFEVVSEEPDDDEDSDSTLSNDEDNMSIVDHVNLNGLAKHLPCLSELRVMYGTNHCGLNFNWNAFRLTLQVSVPHVKRNFEIYLCMAKCYERKVLIQN